MKKEKELTQKEEQVLNKEFKNLNKIEEIEEKQLETDNKLKETKGKLGEKLEVKNALDNSTKKGKILRTLIVCLIVGVIVLGVYLTLKFTGVLNRFQTAEDVKNFILSGGNFSVILFIVIQFLQVTFLPIPAFITTVAGALIFGPLQATIMSLIAIMLGSIFAFFLGRKFGKGILAWIAGKDDAEKWTKKLTDGKYAFFLMMLFPVFPDDVLCIAAGVTNMSFKFFFITNLITRPIGIICTCYLGSGSLIPFSGYGLIVWPILIVLLVVAFVFSIKYKNKIEDFVDSLSKKQKTNPKTSVKIETLNVSDGKNEETTKNTQDDEKALKKTNKKNN